MLIDWAFPIIFRTSIIYMYDASDHYKKGVLWSGVIT